MSEAMPLTDTRRDTLWKIIQALMVVIFLHHALQPLLALAGFFPWKAKYFVSAGGGFLYGTALWCLLRRRPAGLYIAFFGPMSGTLMLSTGALLMWTGAIETEFRQDLSTVLGGIPQMFALAIAVVLLRSAGRPLLPFRLRTDS